MDQTPKSKEGSRGINPYHPAPGNEWPYKSNSKVSASDKMDFLSFETVYAY